MTRIAHEHLEPGPTPDPITFETVRSEVGLKKGETLSDFISRKWGEVRDLIGEKNRVSKAPMPIEEAKAGATAEIDKLAESGRPRARVRNDRVSLDWPLHRVAAEPSGMHSIPSAPDAAALAAWAHRDAICAELESQIDAEYDGVDLALSDTEKRDRVKFLDAEILTAERKLAEAIWQAQEAGSDVDFPGRMDPRAVLGIAGPPLQERDSGAPPTSF